MLLGQIVAISVASNLFYIAVLVFSSSTPTSTTASPLSITPSFYIVFSVSLLTITASPTLAYTNGFLENLLAMHAVLFLPFISPAIISQPITTESLALIYAGIETGSFFLRVKSYADVLSIPLISSTFLFSPSQYLLTLSSSLSSPLFSEKLHALPNSIITTLYSHPAQSSISWDIVWTSVSFIAWAILAPQPIISPRPSIFTQMFTALGLAVGCAVFSVGTVAAFVFKHSTRAEAAAGEGQTVGGNGGRAAGRPSRAERNNWWAGAEDL